MVGAKSLACPSSPVMGAVRAGAAALGWLALGACGLTGCGARSDVITGGGGGEGGSGGGTTTTSACACGVNADCPAGAVCDGCACSAGCAADKPCPGSLGCCGGACTDILTDPEHCGACGSPCEAPNAEMVCHEGGCLIGACDAGWSDCDWQVENGCEASVGTCLCSPGSAAVCYSGPAGTTGVGACLAGTQSCAGGVAWGPCEGEVLPGPEACNGIDDDCDGHGDDWDPDGDGWSKCAGDCCQDTGCADHPELVHPGAYEFPGNGLDDDCDPATPDEKGDCSGPPLQAPTSALDLVKAMDLCVFVPEEGPGWGVVSAELAMADGSTAALPDDLQVGVLADYGPFVLPKVGATMAALSSGTARDEGDPGHVYPQHGEEEGQIGNFVTGSKVGIPAGFLAANGGEVPTPCFPCEKEGCAQAFDSVSLRMRIRTPTNAAGFRYFLKLYTAEYPENVCSEYNDFFVALLDSQHPDIPADGNVAFDAMANPVSVNNAFFDVCQGFGPCPAGVEGLVGTGMGGWDGLLYNGAATSWLEGTVPVVAGETIELHLALWDAMDGNVDSLVLVDGFDWLPPPGVVLLR